MLFERFGLCDYKRRSPYGERGLKFRFDVAADGDWRSLSLRRAWIEILTQLPGNVASWLSLSLRRAWIEILTCSQNLRRVAVALLTESVD